MRLLNVLSSRLDGFAPLLVFFGGAVVVAFAVAGVVTVVVVVVVAVAVAVVLAVVGVELLCFVKWTPRTSG